MRNPPRCDHFCTAISNCDVRKRRSRRRAQKGLIWEADQEYKLGGWDHVGGINQWNAIKRDTRQNILGTFEDPLYQAIREKVRLIVLMSRMETMNWNCVSPNNSASSPAIVYFASSKTIKF